MGAEDEIADNEDAAMSKGDTAAAPGSRAWGPRLVVAHRNGSLVLVTLLFEYVGAGKDREERWACTTLRAELIATHDGVAANEQICDLRGVLPHGVKYMRI